MAARSALYWRRDPRLNFPALITTLFPAGLLFAWYLGDSELALVGMPLASAYMIGWGQHNDVGYDSTAFWLHVASGVDGVSDRVGRLYPSMVLGSVCVPGYAVLAAALGGRWDLLPAMLGAGAALLLSGLGVASVTSSVKQYRCPGPARVPSRHRPGEPASPCSCRRSSASLCWCSPCPDWSSVRWPGSVTTGLPGWPWSWAPRSVAQQRSSGCGSGRDCSSVEVPSSSRTSSGSADAVRRRRYAAWPATRHTEGGAQAERAARWAAPMIPARFSSWAGTSGVRRSSRGRNRSAFFDTPPPTTKRSGHSSASRWE